MKHLGSTYYGHPYLDGRTIFLDGHPLDAAKEPRDNEAPRQVPPPHTNPYTGRPYHSKKAKSA